MESDSTATETYHESHILVYMYINVISIASVLNPISIREIHEFNDPYYRTTFSTHISLEGSGITMFSKRKKNCLTEKCSPKIAMSTVMNELSPHWFTEFL